MAIRTNLLELPRELRDNIWHHALAGLEVTLWSIPASEDKGCLACETRTSRPMVYHDAYIPLLTCKQIYAEASALFSRSLSLHIFNVKSLRSLATNSTHPLSSLTRSLILDVHLDDDIREDWMSTLPTLPATFPRLTQLTINNHMRPPMGYDALIDAIHLAGPLVDFPSRLAYPTHTQLIFAYIIEAVMFENAFLGVVRVSDALEEHEAVIRDLLVDADFAAACKPHDLHRMTNCLLRIARKHEQPWFEALQRRRRMEMRMADEWLE